MTGCVEVETPRATIEVAWENYASDGLVRLSVFEKGPCGEAAFTALNVNELDALILALQEKRKACGTS